MNDPRVKIAEYLIKAAGRIVDADIYNQVIRDNEQLIEVARAAKKTVEDHKEFSEYFSRVDPYNINLLDTKLKELPERLL